MTITNIVFLSQDQNVERCVTHIKYDNASLSLGGTKSGYVDIESTFQLDPSGNSN